MDHLLRSASRTSCTIALRLLLAWGSTTSSGSFLDHFRKSSRRSGYLSLMYSSKCRSGTSCSTDAPLMTFVVCKQTVSGDLIFVGELGHLTKDQNMHACVSECKGYSITTVPRQQNGGTRCCPVHFLISHEELYLQPFLRRGFVPFHCMLSCQHR